MSWKLPSNPNYILPNTNIKYRLVIHLSIYSPSNETNIKIRNLVKLSLQSLCKSWLFQCIPWNKKKSMMGGNLYSLFEWSLRLWLIERHRFVRSKRTTSNTHLVFSDEISIPKHSLSLTAHVSSIIQPYERNVHH